MGGAVPPLPNTPSWPGDQLVGSTDMVWIRTAEDGERFHLGDLSVDERISLKLKWILEE
jgi:hypothetical protein